VQLGGRAVRSVARLPLEGDDVSEIVNRYRNQLPMKNEHMVTMTRRRHAGRALLMRFDHSEASQGQRAFMWRLADQQLDELIADGSHCEFISSTAQPCAMLVVADLLGVPSKIINGSRVLRPEHDARQDRRQGPARR